MRPLLRPLLAATALMAGCTASAHRGRDVGDAADAIRGARARYNDAIARRDTLAIGALLLPSYHAISGASVQTAGADAARHGWAERFATDTTIGYVRTPRDVRVNAAWGLAQETGDWAGHLTARDGRVAVGGVYAAKWQRAASGAWRLQSEVFTTLRCSGGPVGCTPPPAVAP